MTKLKKIGVFFHLGGYTISSRDINSRIGIPWRALNSRKILEFLLTTKTKVWNFESTVESILLYRCEFWVMTAGKKVDTYTFMLKKVKNFFWRDNLTNSQICGQIPKAVYHNQKKTVSACYTCSSAQRACILLFSTPNGARRKRRLNMTLKTFLKKILC